MFGLFRTQDGTLGRVDEFLDARTLEPEDVEVVHKIAKRVPLDLAHNVNHWHSWFDLEEGQRYGRLHAVPAPVRGLIGLAWMPYDGDDDDDDDDADAAGFGLHSSPERQIVYLLRS